MPSALAFFKLITTSNAVGRSIGMGARSEGYKRAAGTEEDIAS